jgi:rhodanese-related sulfurtransferase
MKKSLKNKRIELVLALFAFLLAVFAAVLGDPYRVTEEQKKILKPLEINGLKIDYVKSYQLAQWIMEKSDHFILIDTRKVKEFNSYHVPSAQNLTFFKTNLEKISTDQTIILYSKNNESAVHIWVELKQKGYNEVYLMEGGIKAWATEILFPDLSQAYGLDKTMIERMKKTSLFFGGKPKLGEFESGKSRKRYHREGC